jgi:uncharacterized protein YchJ
MNKELKSHKVGFIGNNGKPFIAAKLGRNDKCLCGSGLKAKNCHGNDTRYYSKTTKP